MAVCIGSWLTYKADNQYTYSLIWHFNLKFPVTADSSVSVTCTKQKQNNKIIKHLISLFSYVNHNNINKDVAVTTCYAYLCITTNL